MSSLPPTPERPQRAGSGRIDVHAHFLPKAYREALRRAGLSQPGGIHAVCTENLIRVDAVLESPKLAE